LKKSLYRAVTTMTRKNSPSHKREPLLKKKEVPTKKKKPNQGGVPTAPGKKMPKKDPTTMVSNNRCPPNFPPPSTLRDGLEKGAPLSFGGGKTPRNRCKKDINTFFTKKKEKQQARSQKVLPSKTGGNRWKNPGLFLLATKKFGPLFLTPGNQETPTGTKVATALTGGLTNPFKPTIGVTLPVKSRTNGMRLCCNFN